ncbi:hypothetical protein JOF34_001887 [Microbacterium amylolyticum]|uniref:50S ribosomal protein L32 n=1 Tax=Microbacterium amylolyticum TaxID=936337 RepID=A0ABS4ZJ51_9MICO|nr:hypothetical protein [Microbacterium amylolyticum]
MTPLPLRKLRERRASVVIKRDERARYLHPVAKH